MRSLKAFRLPSWLWVMGIVGLSAVACGDDDTPTDAAIPDAVTPDRPDRGTPDIGTDAGPQTLAQELGWYGPHPVGHVELEHTYERADGGGSRTIPYEVWYPAASPGDRPARYAFRRAEVSTLNAPPAAGPFPTFAYSHGHQATSDASTFLLEHLASHGWVVLSPLHVGDTVADGGVRMTDIYYLRAWDISKTLDALQSHPMLGSLVGEPMAVGGHSFGGYTAIALGGATFDVDAIVARCDEDGSDPICTDLDEAARARLRAGLVDPRFAAVVAIAAGDARRFGDGPEGATGVATLDVPLLELVAEGDGHPADSASEDPYWLGRDGSEDLRVNLLGAAHNTFSDICDFAEDFLDCPVGYDAKEGWFRTRAVVHAFLRSRVLDDPAAAALFTEPGALDDTVEIVRP